MPTDTMDPATAVTYGPFIQAAEAQYSSDPSVVNPATITNMPAGYTLVRTIQMTDFFGPEQSRVFYGYVAVGGDPITAVVALRGTESTMELAVHRASLRWTRHAISALRAAPAPSSQPSSW